MQNPLTSLTHRERTGLAVAVSILALFGVGSTLYRSSAAPLQPTVFPLVPSAPQTPIASPKPTPKAPSRSVVVYVSGAVLRPGVYSLPPGQRLYHAVQKAGGFKSGAQQDALNLAAYLQDADQIHVPLHSTTATTVPSTAPHLAGVRVLGRAQSTSPTTRPESASSKFHNPGDGKIKLSSATLEDLQKLPGVGPSTARSILDYRKESGGFKELEEVKEVRGIGEKKFAKMQPFLTL
ncbi:helix-hairpin-helix domain-containing protein [Armatimonas sp.]|uniref:helix-hairpin-helix domain-containing protein n=1 Tax=Armatimonas sp. TaxID=1872638 RepID=UPI0037500EDF